MSVFRAELKLLLPIYALHIGAPQALPLLSAHLMGKLAADIVSL